MVEGMGMNWVLCPMCFRGEEHSFCTGDFSEESLTSRGLKHSDTHGTEVVDALEDWASCYVSSAVEDTTTFIKFTDIVVYEFA